MNVYVYYYHLINWYETHGHCLTFTVPQLIRAKGKLITATSETVQYLGFFSTWGLKDTVRYFSDKGIERKALVTKFIQRKSEH